MKSIAYNRKGSDAGQLSKKFKYGSEFTMSHSRLANIHTKESMTSLATFGYKGLVALPHHFLVKGTSLTRRYIGKQTDWRGAFFSSRALMVDIVTLMRAAGRGAIV